MKQRVAVVPSYEPDNYLASTVGQLMDNGLEVVVIDDGSGEAYASFFDALPDTVHVISYPVNRGKGHALKQGFAYLYERYGCDCTVVTVDSDGQHRIPDVLAVLERAEATPDRLILGSRYLEKSAPLRSRFGNGVTRAVYRLVAGVGVHDTQTGLRAFDGGLLEGMLDIPGERYEYEMNVLLTCPRRHVKIDEVRIDAVYLDNNSRSHFRALADSFKIYKNIFKFAASSFIGFLMDLAVYSLLLLLQPTLGETVGLVVANVGARLVSATVNYTLNRRYVFHSRGSVIKSAAGYALLAVGILVGNTLVLSLLVNVCRITPVIAKLLTEIVFFFLSWLIQKLYIFR